MSLIYPQPERITKRVHVAVEFARSEAETLRHAAIEPAHILLGLLSESAGIAALVLHDVGLSLDEARRVVAGSLRTATGDASSLNATPATQQVLSDALDEADQLNHHYCGTEHVLLGLVRTHDPRTIDFFARLNIVPEQIHRAVVDVMRYGHR
jgi:ATP-dependent Clp protease ATP-binding subunit ClpC